MPARRKRSTKRTASPRRRTASTRKSSASSRRRTAPKSRVRKATTTRRASSRKSSTPWTRSEMAFMRKFYRNYETAWVARQVGRTVYSVRYKAVDLGIKKASPSVWRGNRGNTGAFKSFAKTPGISTSIRKVSSRRSSTKRGYKASTKRSTSSRRTSKSRSSKKKIASRRRTR